MNQDDAYALLVRGRDFLARGFAHQAALVLERASQLEPDKASIREELARALYLTGRKARAGEEFSWLLEREPSNDYAHFCLGLCQVATGNRAQALGHLKIALAMRPDCEDYRSALDRLAG